MTLQLYSITMLLFNTKFLLKINACKLVHGFIYSVTAYDRSLNTCFNELVGVGTACEI